MRVTVLILLTVLCHTLYAQDENKFKNFHGLKQAQGNVEFFEAEGSAIFIQPLDYGLDEKGLSKIKKRYSIKDGQLTTDSLLHLQVLQMCEQKHGVTAYFTYYLIPETAKKSKVIGLT
jgi:hypothetical protein